MKRFAALPLAPLLLVAACGDDAGTGGGGAGDATSSTTGSGTTTSSSGMSTTSTSGGTGGGGGSCDRDPGAADKERFVVVGHPYDDAMDPDGTFEVLRLSTAGELTSTGTRFSMGRPADRAIRFTPDGEVGFAVQDDGTVGVFRLDAAGNVTVLNEALAGDFYAENLRWDDDLGGVYVVDTNFPENGGGIYTIGLGCDEALTPGPRLFESKSARDILFHAGTKDALLAARGALGSTTVAHVHRLDLGPPPSAIASVDAFGDDEAITSWVALTRNGKHLVLGDNSAFSAVPNRVAAVEVTATGLGAVQTIEGFEDPYSIAVSPFDDAVIVTSGFGDGIFVFDYDPATAQPLTLRGELPYEGSPPQLPGALATVDRGSLDGLVLIADVRGVYQVRFGANATVDDLGVVVLGDGAEDIVVGIGIQP